MQTSKKGWFGGFFGGSSKKSGSEEIVTQEEMDKLENFMKENFEEEKQLEISSDYILFYLDFNLLSGKIFLNKKKDNQQEGVSLIFSCISSIVKVRESNMEVNLKLQNFDINLVQNYIDIDNYRKIPFLSKNLKSNQENSCLFSLDFEKNPLENKNNNEIKIGSSIKSYLNSTQIVFNPVLIKILIQIFDVETDENLKNAARDELEKTIESTKVFNIYLE